MQCYKLVWVGGVHRWQLFVSHRVVQITRVVSHALTHVKTWCKSAVWFLRDHHITADRIICSKLKVKLFCSVVFWSLFLYRKVQLTLLYALWMPVTAISVSDPLSFIWVTLTFNCISFHERVCLNTTLNQLF